MFLTNKIIEINSKFKFNLQYALWDQFKVLESYNNRKLSNLAKFSADLASKKSLGLNLIRFFDFENPSKQHVVFLKVFLKNLLQESSIETMSYLIENVKKKEENFVFIEQLKDFLKVGFLKGLMKDQNEEVFEEGIGKKLKFAIKKLK